MVPAVFRNHPFVEVGVAIGAPERATVIAPHVCRFNAVTTWPLVPVFGDSVNAEQSCEQSPVNAGTMLDAEVSQICFFAAGINLHGIPVCDALESAGYLFQSVFVSGSVDVVQYDVALAQYLVQPPSPLAVKIVKAEHQPPGGAFQQAGKPCRLLQMPFDRSSTGENNRVVAPDHPLRPDAFGQFAKRGNPFAGRRQMLFKGGIIGIQGELEVVVQAALVKFGQMRHQRSGILGPETDGVHMLRFQAEAGHLSTVERVDPVEVAFPDSLHEPVGIKGRYVSAPAGGDDHGVVFGFRSEVVNPLVVLFWRE